MTSPAREEILATVRRALPLAGTTAADIPKQYCAIARTYRREGKLEEKAVVEMFTDRLRDYDTDVVEAGNETLLPSVIAEIFSRSGETTVLVPNLLPLAWLPATVTVVVDHDLPVHEIDGIAAVLTTCETAVAETGTIVLVHEGTQGRRVATLLPDHHICIVRKQQIRELVPEAFATLPSHAGLLMTTISGPSATSDIEMVRIGGVHGPRRLTVILLQ